MKKIVNLLLFASCLMLMNNIKIQNNIDFYESTNDILDKDNEKISIRKLNEGDISYSKIFAQHAQNGDDHYLRFAVALKGDISNIKFVRTMENKEDNTKYVSTIYKGISSGNTTYYYDGNNLITEENDNTNQYYWACYTIKTSNINYLNTKITVSLFLNDQKIDYKTTTINSLITNSLKLTKGFSKLDYYLNEKLDFSTLEIKRINGANKEENLSYLDCALYDNGKFIDWNNISSLSFGEHKFMLKYDDKEINLDPINLYNGYYASATNIIETANITENDKYFLEKDSSSPMLKVSSDVGVKYAGEIKKGSNLKFHVYSEKEGYANVILKVSSATTSKGPNAWSPIVTADVKMSEIMTFSYTNNKGTFNREFDDNLVAKGGRSTKTNENGEIVYDMNLFVNWNELNFGAIYLTKGDNVVNFNMNGNVGSGQNAGINVFSLETLFSEKYEFTQTIYGKDLKSKSDIDFSKQDQNYVYKNDGATSPSVKTDAGIKYIGELAKGAIMNFAIYLPVDQFAEFAELKIKASSLSRKCYDIDYWKPTETNDILVSDILDLKVNDEDFKIDDSLKINGFASKRTTPYASNEKCDNLGRYYDNTIWVAWTQVSLGKFKLKKGYNFITLTSRQNLMCNFYSLDVVFHN